MNPTLVQPKTGLGSVAETNRLLGGNYFADTGEQLKNFTPTPSGNTFNANAIANSTGSVNLPTTQLSTSDAGINGAVDAKITGGFESAQKEYDTALQDYQKKQEVKSTEGKNKVVDYIKKKVGILESKDDLEAEAKVPELNKLSNDAYNELQKNKLAQLQEIEVLDKTPGMTTAGKAQAQNRITSKYALQNAALAVSYDVANRNLLAAEKSVEDKIKTLTAPIDEYINYYSQFLSSNEANLTNAEKAQLESLKTEAEFERDRVKQTQEDIFEVQKTAAENGADFATLQAIGNAKTAQEALQKAGKYNSKTTADGGTYTDKQLKAITKINQDVSKNSTYAKTTSMRNYGDNVIASLSLGSGAGDIAAINQFQKVIDEGAVTRDQDVKLIQGSQSLANTLRTKIKRLEKGEQLSPDLRTQMRQAVEKMYAKQVEALQKDPYIAAKTKEAELNGLTVGDTILGELGTFNLPEEETRTPIYNGLFENKDYRSTYGY